MTNKELVLGAMRQYGLQKATELQGRAPEMDGTALYGEKDFIPDFQKAKGQANMLTRPAGFVCKSTAGRVVKLIQPYDSETFPGEPEELSAQWGFQWSKDPKEALPFVAMATSPYGKGACCTDNGKVYRSKMDNLVVPPSAYPDGWEEVEA